MTEQPVLTRESVLETLKDVQDPEVRLSILALNLLDNVDIAGGQVTVRFHLTTPFCPATFASSIAEDIKHRVSGLPGVSNVEVELLRHYSAEDINREVNGATRSPLPPGNTYTSNNSEGTSDGLYSFESKALLSYASVRRLVQRVERATRSEYRARWSVQGLQRFRDVLGIADLDGYIVECKGGHADPDAALAHFCNALYERGYPTSAVAGLCSGPKLWMRANGVSVGHRFFTGGSVQDASPLPFPQMGSRMRFSLIALTSGDLSLAELTALRLSDFGEWDGKRGLFPDVTADPLAVLVGAEVAKDGQERITFLSYDAQRALLSYLAESRRDTPAPVLADSPEGLLSDNEMRLVRRLLSNLVKTGNEANVFLCVAAAEVMGKLG